MYRWKTPTATVHTQCVTVQHLDDEVRVKRTKHPDADDTELVYTEADFKLLLDEIRTGFAGFDNDEGFIYWGRDRSAMFRDLTGATIVYDADEIDAFEAGVNAGEFDLTAVPA